MKKTPLARGTKTLKRSGFKRKATPVLKNVSKGVKCPVKRKKKSPLQKLKAQLWELCKNITRKQYGNTCYTCNKGGLEKGNWQTGHFISSSICSTELRYDLQNLRPQCYNCNINKSGNWLAYEQHLIRDNVDVTLLKQKNEKTKNLMYREEWYEQKIEEYQAYFDSL